MKLVLCMNGRSVREILKDVRREFPEHAPRVVLLPDDGIPPPEGVPTLCVEETLRLLTGGEELDVILIANGGMSQQMVPVLIQLLLGWEAFRGTYRIVNLQREEGVRVFHERAAPLAWMDKPARGLTEKEIFLLCLMK